MQATGSPNHSPEGKQIYILIIEIERWNHLIFLYSIYIGQLSCWPDSGQHYNQYDICTTSSHLSKYEYQDETQSRANNQHSFLSLIFPNKNLINILKIIKERKREMNYYFLYIFVGKMCFLFPTIEKERCREF